MNTKTEIEQHIEIDEVIHAEISKQLNNLQAQVNDLAEDLKSLLGLFEQARGVVTFVKWLVALGSALGATILFIKDHVK
jgi:hypothetical protein